jgi:protein subunit release factor A
MGNYRDNSVTVTHLPTGLSATCDEFRSTFRNKEKAMSMLRGKM